MLDQANELLRSKNQQSIIKSYNSFKTLYIRSILESDENLKKEALKGLIESSKKLGFDYRDYEQELKRLSSKSENVPKKVVKVEKKIKKDIKKESIDSSKKIVLKSIKLKKGEVELYFSDLLDKNSIKSFILADKKSSIYKKVFDIKSIWPYPKREYSLRSVKKMKIAQFNKDWARVVFEDNKPIKIDFNIEKDVLKIFLNGNKKKEEKVVEKDKKYDYRFYRTQKTIVIDPGHGGKDAGAVGYKRKKEKDAVLAVAKKLYKELKNRGYKVYLTRTKDYFVELRNRTKYANRRMADIFISIHANAAPKKSKYLSMRGIETFFLSPARSKRAKRVAALENRADLDSMGYFSKMTFLNFLNREKIIASNKLAIDIQKGMLYNLRKHFKDVQDGGVREGPFWVLVGAQMPSVLIEIGYITNPTEARRIFNPYYQTLLAKGIADGIDSYFEKNR
ncbi:N-acetylmuramoyl-L-alanine amidase family protein [Nitrosophilus labii]|uniref:N-acetylmuramoyl-L-alanine amidase family protein n=1 Tax=Nitrosophilus labii TaxID=2706014 RepID=UPI00165731BE|nr:N-acetylmuramoyl-L-alanine amidase [Nitrosophilus labii]